MDVVWFLVIGGLAGWLAGGFLKGGGFGLVGNVALGILGGVVGGSLFDALGLRTDGGRIGSLVTSFVGALVVLFVVGLLKKPKK